MRSLRITLLGLAAGAQVASWVLSNQEVGGVPIPLPLTLFAVIPCHRLVGAQPPQCRADYRVPGCGGLVNESPISRRFPWPTLVAVVAWALAVAGTFWWLSPIKATANPLTGPWEEVALGEVTVTAYLGADTGSASMGGAIMGSGPDGSWGYTHTGSYLEEWPDSNGQVLIPSPDGAHVAASFSVGLSDEPGRLQHVVVFEAATGRVAARASFSGFVNVQLTNSVVLMGRDAYSLTDGSLLWSADVGLPLRRSMTAAPEHLIIDTECERADDGLDDCLLYVLPQDDPDAETRIVRALTDPATNQIVVVDGWTLTSKAPVQPDAGGRVSRSLVAVNLGTGESVEGGGGVGPDGSKFGRLGIRSASDPSEPESAASWFDPETRQVQR